MVAAGQGRRGGVTPEEAVAGDQIVGEHADRPGGEFRERGDGELDFRVGEVREDFAEHVQPAVVAEFVEVAVAPDRHLKLEVVVRTVARRPAQHAAFAAAVAAAEQNRFEFLRGNESADAAEDAGAGALEVAFERVVAIERKARRACSDARSARDGGGRGWRGRAGVNGDHNAWSTRCICQPA